MQRPHDKGEWERAVGFMVSTTTGKVGGDKRGKGNAEVPKFLLACTHVRCMVLRACVLLITNTLTPSVQSHPAN
jgi:hypothetical protein